MTTNLHVLTGAPGTGKTAILEKIRTEVWCVPEPAREVLAQQRLLHGAQTPEPTPARFVDLLLQRSIAKYQEARKRGGVVVFDRGVPDCIGYALHLGSDPMPSISAAEIFRYNPEVLIVEPWAEIYTTDDERTMSFDAVVEFHDRLLNAYDRAGYTLVEVRRGSIEDRAGLVRSHIEAE